MRKWLWTVFVLAMAITGYTTSAANAGRDACYGLWVERNAIYKEHGYCFQSWRARSFFGNDGCAFWDEYQVPLSWRASERVADIVEREHAYGCRWDPPYGY